MKSRAFLVSSCLLLASLGCRKNDVPAPPVPPYAPDSDATAPVAYHFAERIAGPHVWRNGSEVRALPVRVSGNADEEGFYVSDAWYKFSSVSGTFAIYTSSTYKVLFDTANGSLMWVRGAADTLYSTAGQQEKWKTVVEKLLELKLYSRRIERMAPVPWDTIMFPPDTLANILELFGRYAPGKSSYGSGPALLGVDSAYLEYQDMYYDHGPSVWRVSGKLYFFPLTDSASMEVYPMHLGDSRYDFRTR